MIGLVACVWWLSGYVVFLGCCKAAHGEVCVRDILAGLVFGVLGAVPLLVVYFVTNSEALDKFLDKRIL